jgi:PKD repeat protein
MSHRSGAVVGCLTLAVVGALVAPPVAAQPIAAAAAPLVVTADYQMNEPTGSTTMTDGSGNGLDAPVDLAGVQPGAMYAAATGYNWTRRSPATLPVEPQRVIQVPDDPNLEPGAKAFTIEIRYRTKEKFGNIVQKGQANTPGGQWKVQNPKGIPSCLFQGSDAQVATGAGSALNDNEWHTLTCELTSTGVTMYVDGVFRSRKNGVIGSLDNAFPMTVGGKIECDQVAVTCDYFSGQIDYIRLSKEPGQQPLAGFADSCVGLVCSLDSSASADPDGAIVAYQWSFGDGYAATSANPSHAYASPGSYPVAVTVTDNDGETSTVTRTVVVSGTAASSVNYVGMSAKSGNTATPTVKAPSTAAVGDRLVLALALNSVDRAVTSPGPDWTLVDTAAAGSMSTSVWTKVASAGDAGSGVTVQLDAPAKFTMSVAAYSGVDGSAAVSSSHRTDLVTHTERISPVVDASPGAWVVSYWADKSSTTTAWSADQSLNARSQGCALSTGRVCSVFADSGAPVPARYGNVSASTDAPSSTATILSIVLPAA